MLIASAQINCKASARRAGKPLDRETGVIVRLTETIGGGTTRDAVAVEIAPDAPLPPTVFEFSFPTDATLIY